MYKYVKRFLDFITSSLLFVVISPLFLVLAILVKVKLGSPVLFKQKRAGMNCRTFEMYKFRTMTEERDSNGSYLPDELRMTKFGSWLRSSSLDELPELLNIIKGDMSVIGPRPLPVEYNDYYRSGEKARFIVRGGLLPPDAIAEKDIISWEDQLHIEKLYAESLSFSSDVKIFFKAIKLVFMRSKNNYGSFVRKSLIEERGSENEV